MLFLSAVLSQGIEHNTIVSVSRILHLLKVKVSTPSIKQVVTEHPNFPSLLSVSDALKNWKIDNISIKTDFASLVKYPTPILVQLSENNSSYFTVVKEVKSAELIISDRTKQKWIKISKSDFEKKWTGVTTLLEAGKDAGEEKYGELQKKYRVTKVAPLALVILLLILCAVQITHWITASNSTLNTWAKITLLIIKLFGCYVTGLLLWYEIDKHNSGIQKVCKSGKKINCHAILQSSASKIWGLSWGEIGFIYFSAGLLALISSQAGTPYTYALAWLNALALPYIFFSIYYQWRIARQWCILCLAVQGLLALELVVNLIGHNFQRLTLSSSEIVQFILLFGIPTFGWLLLKPILINARDNKNNKKELSRLKRNTQLFESLLINQKKVDIVPTGLGIILGSQQPKYRLLKVCNPYCGPCAKAHPEIDDLLQKNPDLQVQIIFTASNKIGDTKAPPVKHLMALAEKQIPGLTKDALDSWYNSPSKDYTSFSEKYPLSTEDLDAQGYKLEQMDNWCRDMRIEFTPTIFLQDMQLPDLYQIEDLKYFLIPA